MSDSDDRWAEREHHLFGRTPMADDLLNRHLSRTGTRKAVETDPAAHLQVALLRQFLDVLRAALDDEHVDPDASRRVVERVIYGSVPSPAEVEYRTGLTSRLAQMRVQAPTEWKLP